MREFHGYANSEATKKKIVHNVFKKGDCYFLTGELFFIEIYCYYFNCGVLCTCTKLCAHSYEQFLQMNPCLSV